MRITVIIDASDPQPLIEEHNHHDRTCYTEQIEQKPLDYVIIFEFLDSFVVFKVSKDFWDVFINPGVEGVINKDLNKGRNEDF